MTKRKRILSVIMAVAMVASMMFAMTANTYATENNTKTVTVEFIDEAGTVYEVQEVTFDDSFVRTAYSTDGNPGTAVIRDNRPTVMDATYAALKALGKDNDMITGWDTVDPRGGMYVTKMLGLQTETAADTSETVWRGYAWEYEIGYVKSELYATNVEVQDGDVISWWYRYCEEPMK